MRRLSLTRSSSGEEQDERIIKIIKRSSMTPVAQMGKDARKLRTATRLTS